MPLRLDCNVHGQGLYPGLNNLGWIFIHLLTRLVRTQPSSLYLTDWYDLIQGLALAISAYRTVN